MPVDTRSLAEDTAQAKGTDPAADNPAAAVAADNPAAAVAAVVSGRPRCRRTGVRSCQPACQNYWPDRSAVVRRLRRARPAVLSEIILGLGTTGAFGSTTGTSGSGAVAAAGGCALGSSNTYWLGPAPILGPRPAAAGRMSPTATRARARPVVWERSEFPSLLPGSPFSGWAPDALLVIMTPRASVVAGGGDSMRFNW